MNRPTARYFAIFGTMRTGSNLLERLINQYAGLDCYGELFNPHFIGTSDSTDFEGIGLSERERDPHALIERAIAKSGDRLPGFRIFQGHDTRIEAAALASDDCAKIILRRDPLDSFVSLCIARKTNQWILGNATSRKTAKITFDADEYRSYLSALNAYYAHIQRMLQTHGQTAFELRYEDLKNPKVMNGLATYLGHPEDRKNFKEPIKRQNPEPLSEKVENYSEMIAALGGISAAPTAPVRGEAGFAVKDIVINDTPQILFAPVPGTAKNPVMSWLKGFDGGRSRGLTRNDISDWLDASPGMTALTLVEHPLTRAYRVFQKRIFTPDEGQFKVIAERLSAHYGLVIPEGAPSLDETASAFEAFLSFLKVNLAGQTSLRIDPEWAHQTDHLEAVTEFVPMARVIRDRDLPRASRQIATQYGYDIDPAGIASHGGGHPLAKIYSPRLEKLCRDAYQRDYRRLGFGDWATE